MWQLVPGRGIPVTPTSRVCPRTGDHGYTALVIREERKFLLAYYRRSRFRAVPRGTRPSSPRKCSGRAGYPTPFRRAFALVGEDEEEDPFGNSFGDESQQSGDCLDEEDEPDQDPEGNVYDYPSGVPVQAHLLHV